MPIEIKELIIKATVGTNASAGNAETKKEEETETAKKEVKKGRGEEKPPVIRKPGK